MASPVALNVGNQHARNCRPVAGVQEPSPYEFGILLGLEMGLKATPKVLLCRSEALGCFWFELPQHPELEQSS